ncbi:hypothetical protein JD488_12955 [Aeromonas jandaei]|uniref:HEPN domain-containing protein n=1 Tax=Aeromonas jandaei TaxID=650 RepID=UPI00191D23FB|nr:hypothetical protein [Aeromonas jandaei]
MPYTKSLARKDFESVIEALKTLSYSASLKKNKIPYDIQQCVYRNAIFQASSALEMYVKTILEDWLHQLHQHSHPLTMLPKELVFLAIGKKQKEAFKKYLLNDSESELVSGLMSLNTLPNYFNDTTLVRDAIRTNEHINDKKYPSHKNMVTIFKRFGIKDIMKSIQIRGKKDYRKILESFSDIRTEIAHQYPSSALTFTDIKTQLSSISNLVSMVDTEMYWHVFRTSDINCWKT